MAPTLRGLVLLHADVAAASTWVQRGVTPAYVVPVDGWTAVVPAGAAQASAPYDDALKVTAAHAAPSRARPAIGLFVIEERAVLTVHARGLRARTRWLVWQSGRGVSDVPGMPQARPGDFVRAAGVVYSAQRRLHTLLHERAGEPLQVCVDVLDILALPGGDLLRGVGVKDNPESTLVEPDPASVTRFDKVTADEQDMRREIEENS